MEKGFKRLNIRVGAEVKEGLDDLAREYGMSTSALCAYFLGHTMASHKRAMTAIPGMAKMMAQSAMELADLEPKA